MHETKTFAMKNSNSTQHSYRIHYIANNSAAQQFVARVTMHTLDTTLNLPASCQNQLYPVMSHDQTSNSRSVSSFTSKHTLITTLNNSPWHACVVAGFHLIRFTHIYLIAVHMRNVRFSDTQTFQQHSIPPL